MFRFTRDGTKVQLAVSLAVPYYETREFWFSWESKSEVFAGLLVAAFNNALRSNRLNFQTAAYEQGWQDAKAKRAKGASKYW